MEEGAGGGEMGWEVGGWVVVMEMEGGVEGGRERAVGDWAVEGMEALVVVLHA
jgi:hypothetical protein